MQRRPTEGQGQVPQKDQPRLYFVNLPLIKSPAMKNKQIGLLILSTFFAVSICYAQRPGLIVVDTVYIKMSDVFKPATPGMLFFNNRIPVQTLAPGQAMAIPYHIEDPVPNISGVWLGSCFGSGAPLLIFSIALLSENSGFKLYLHNPNSYPVSVDGIVVRYFMALSQP
jgi:hypothetical protein